MPRRPLPEVRRRIRRAWYLLRQIRWWALLALLTGLCAAVVAVTVQDALQEVLGLAALSITLAVLATREES